MKVVLESEKQEWRVGETIRVRVLAVNDSYEPSDVDRRLLIGPNPVTERPGMLPFAVSAEPGMRDEQKNIVTLNPWGVFGRERTFTGLPAGKLTLHAYVLREDVAALRAEGPQDPDLVLFKAEPLVLTIR